MWLDEASVVVKTSPPVTLPSASYRWSNVVLCSCVTDMWDRLTYGPPLSVTVGA